MKTETQYITRKSRWFPICLLLVAGAGMSFTLLLQRADLTAFGLILAVPLALAAIILFIGPKTIVSTAAAVVSKNKIQFAHLYLINVIIFIISLILLLASSTRPLAYFILISCYSGLILWQVLWPRPGWTNYLILAEILFLSLNLIWGVNLRYALYFGDTDTLVHMQLINTILQTGHVDSYLFYKFYPLYHIYIAIGNEITGLSLETALFVIMGLAWQGGILFAFLLFRKLVNNKLALIACLLYASSSQLVYYGSYSIARSLAFVFFIFWIHLIFNQAQKSLRYLFLSLIVMSALILTHHLNVLYIIPVLVLIYLVQICLNRARPERIINPYFICLLLICSLSYLVWVASEMSGSSLPVTIQSLLNMDLNLSANPTGGYGFSVLPSLVYYSLVLLLGLLGITIAFSRHKFSFSTNLPLIISVSGFILLAVYIPGPLNLISASNIILAARFQLLVSPFIALLIAFGLYYLVNASETIKLFFQRKTNLMILPAGSVIVLTFFSLISIGNSEDTNLYQYTSTSDSPYFDRAELKSFSFLADKGDNQLPLHADYQTTRNSFSLGNFARRNIIESGDISYIQNGYLILRVAELARKKALTFSPDGRGRQLFRYHPDPVSPELDILKNLSFENKIYGSADIQIFMVHHSENH
jgi:hypothetical protein